MPLTEIPTETPTEPQQPVRIVAGRHGELDTHELIRLLDTFEDERSRGRFRESLYVSIFVWIAIAWLLTYGQRMWWHPPKLKTPTEEHLPELTNLQLPSEHLPTPAVKPAPPAPRPTIDRATMDRLRAEPMAAPPPPAPTPTPPPPPVVTTPTPHIPPPVVAEAPTAQPNFGRTQSSGNAIQDALHGAAHDRGGFSPGGNPLRHSGPLNVGGAEVLTQTDFDFNPYVRRILGDIKRNWDPLIPTEAGSPLYKQGESYIRFTILADGTIKDASMHLDGSTHDEAINRSCWGSITSEGQFPPLPKDFHGPELELRIHFLVNKELPQ
jgi:hypothetical protein